jgi:hypothetical protein
MMRAGKLQPQAIQSSVSAQKGPDSGSTRNKPRGQHQRASAFLTRYDPTVGNLLLTRGKRRTGGTRFVLSEQTESERRTATSCDLGPSSHPATAQSRPVSSRRPGWLSSRRSKPSLQGWRRGWLTASGHEGSPLSAVENAKRLVFDEMLSLALQCESRLILGREKTAYLGEEHVREHSPVVDDAVGAFDIEVVAVLLGDLGRAISAPSSSKRRPRQLRMVSTKPAAAHTRKAAAKVITETADHRAENVLPVIRAIQKAGATSLRAIADALNARGIPTARGGRWQAQTVSNVLARA